MPPVVFLPLAAVLAFLLVAFVMRRGKNRDGDIITPDGPRPMIFGSATKSFARILPCSGKGKEKLKRFLGEAGRYHRQALDEFLALRNVLTISWLLLSATVFVVFVEPGTPAVFHVLVVGSIGTLACFALPRLFLESMAKSRLHRIEHGLPDALDMIGMCMTGGLPLPQSLCRVSDEFRSSHPDLAFELRVVGRQMEAGSLRGALQKFSKRIHTTETQALAAIVGQTEQQGASVALAFQTFADNMREQRRQLADELGNKTAVKMLFPLVLCLAPPVYLMLLAPAVIEIKNFLNRENSPGGVLSATSNVMNDMDAALDNIPEAYTTESIDQVNR
jgi:tight adherence protein C